jgi:hypothetical protein
MSGDEDEPPGGGDGPQPVPPFEDEIIEEG